MGKRIVGLAVILLAVMALSACTQVPTPNERLSQYVKLWKNNDFKDMYQGYLSSSATKDTKPADFVDRYPKIYKGLDVKNLKVTYKPVKEADYKKNNKVTIPVTISFDTMAGPIHYTENMVMEKKEVDKQTNWFVDWTPSFILPGLAKGDTIQPVTENPVRGEIMDRNGSKLAANGTVNEIGIVPEQMKGHEKQVETKLSQLLGLPAAEIDQQLKASWVQPQSFVPIKKLSPDQNKLIPQLFKLPGVDKQAAEARVYPLGKAASHLVGYVGPITAEELAAHKNEGYTASSLIGKRGLEQLYDLKLRGKPGEKIEIVASDGKVKNVVAEQKVQNGENIKVTIDGNLQKKIYGQMQNNAGTSAAINPKTGEVLALVSTPAFDPNAFELGMSSQDYSKLQNDPLQPLINRFALSYAPGSSMKPITGAIALDTGTIKPSDTKTIIGRSWTKKGWGSYSVTRVDVNNAPENMETAMMYSDNIFFAQTALDMGADKFINGLKKFGFGQTIPFDYPLKDSQISSTGTFNSEGQLADSGFGQGQVQLNILHLAVAYTPFIDNGSMIKPHLLLNNEKTSYWKENIIKPATASEIAHMMRTVVIDPRGTGHLANLPGMQIAGKTGTAELKKDKQEKNGKENGVFVAYDQKNPTLLIAMLVEGVQDLGGSHAVVQKVANVFQK
ncbi:penicillin-binding transpeptidase domain-containing protein [Heyndrickxia acidicola]|uniref:serine-type D-Ala-D-Ala carboxypeptidase n=1 Tax=Heyndrickxia acidicola TaxID=209389 RepID=A0ABU6MJ93_9BACI|nr:penicillin-binding transpeptidase domain-containing protein [Heyndrickxia acidicola]MED1203297.1 penicillin-binding transpeptidase domain-containing protein [Heyndrickxia acidicola]